MKRRYAHRRTASVAATPVTATPKPWAIASTIVFLGLLTYANSFSNPFILDDQGAILENRQIRSLWPISTPLSPPDETPVARRPLVNLSFALNYAIHGLDVQGYHLGNLAIHLASALVLFGLVRRTLALGDLPARFGAHATAVAAVCALVWTLHPLHTEIVNYVSQRTTALKGLFYLLTLYCSVRGLTQRGYWRAAAVISCAAGMASKESMVTAPVLVLLFDRTFVFGSFAEAIRRRRSLYLGLAGTWAILWALIASGSRTTVGFDTGVSAWTYLLNQAPVVLHYLQLSFWPRALVVDYGVTPPVEITDVLWAGGIIVSLLIAALATIRFFPRAGFLCMSVFVLLAPTSSIVPIATEVGADRRMQLPLAAIVILTVCLMYLGGRALQSNTMKVIGQHAPDRRRLIWSTAAAALVVAVCGMLATRTLLRNREYESRLTLATTTVERRPHGRAYYTLANELFNAGRRDDALRYFRRSAQDFAAAHFPLGSELLADGQLEAGIAELRTFTALMPNHPSVGGARQMIATAFVDLGKYEDAVTELNFVLRIEPNNSRAHALLGELLLRDTARRGEAIHHLERAVTLRPRDAHVRDLLGNALALQGRFAEALMQFRLAVEIDPAYEPARANLVKLDQLLAATSGR